MTSIQLYSSAGRSNGPTEWSYSHGFILTTAFQNISRSSSVRVMGEYTAGMPSWPGMLVEFPLFRNRKLDALMVYMPEKWLFETIYSSVCRYYALWIQGAYSRRCSHRPRNVCADPQARPAVRKEGCLPARRASR